MTEPQSPIATSPLTHEMDVRRLKSGGDHLMIQPKKNVLKALAEAHDLLEITQFEAKLVVRPWRKNGARLTGQFKANVVHPCSVTLKPVPQSIKAEFEANFAPLADAQRITPQRDVSDGATLYDIDDDGPDYFEGATIDVGAAIEEFFGLELDPFPRADDAALPNEVQLTPEVEAAEKPSPFAGLANWKPKADN